jgi:hypothetical protein
MSWDWDSLTTKGKLLTTTTIAIVDITITTHWSRRQNSHKACKERRKVKMMYILREKNEVYRNIAEQAWRQSHPLVLEVRTRDRVWVSCMSVVCCNNCKNRKHAHLLSSLMMSFSYQLNSEWYTFYKTAEYFLQEKQYRWNILSPPSVCSMAFHMTY